MLLVSTRCLRSGAVICASAECSFRRITHAGAGGGHESDESRDEWQDRDVEVRLDNAAPLEHQLGCRIGYRLKFAGKYYVAAEDSDVS